MIEMKVALNETNIRMDAAPDATSVYETAHKTGYDSGYEAGYKQAGEDIVWQDKLVTPSTNIQDILADEGRTLKMVTVAPVDRSIDMNIQSQNILEGVTILGVEGTDKGYEAGKSEGHEEGYELGYYDGHKGGYSDGYEIGHTEGHETGYSDGYTEGHETGKQAQYDEFWDTFQNNGKRADYMNVFSSSYWTVDTFKPKYDIKPQGTTVAQYMFSTCQMNIDLADHLEKLGITLDFSGVTYDFMYTFSNSHFTRIGVVDVSNAKNVNQLFFYSSKLETIDEIIIAETVNPSQYMFQGVSSLKNVKFTGTIGKSIYFNQSPLTVDSMKSVISALKNYAGTENADKYTVKFNTACWTALEASGAAPNGDTWKEYVQALGWLI